MSTQDQCTGLWLWYRGLGSPLPPAAQATSIIRGTIITDWIKIAICGMNIGAFLAPLAVAPPTELLGTQALVLALGLLRLLVPALFVLNPMRSEAHHELYAARHHP
jgi:hypothetical protein